MEETGAQIDDQPIVFATGHIKKRLQNDWPPCFAGAVHCGKINDSM
jgi:hypothetical protein